jgi:hypothetical protein
MNYFLNLSNKARLLSTVSALALMAGCSGPFDPNGTIGGSIQIGPDGKPTFSLIGDFVVGPDPKEEPVVKPIEEEEAAQEAATDNVVYLFQSGTIRNRPVDAELIATLSHIVETKLPPGTMINVTSGGQDPKGEGPNRTGSTRHDVDANGHGQAVDFFLTLDGKKVLPGTHPEIYAALIFEAAKYFPWIGHYSWGVHIGYGAPAFWGPDTSSKTADPDFREAYIEGREAA